MYVELYCPTSTDAVPINLNTWLVDAATARLVDGTRAHIFPLPPKRVRTLPCARVRVTSSDAECAHPSLFHVQMDDDEALLKGISLVAGITVSLREGETVYVFVCSR
jgi:hypothetical protein